MKAFQILILVNVMLTPWVHAQTDVVYEVIEANGSIARLTADEFYKVTRAYPVSTNLVADTSDQYTGRIKYMNPRNHTNVMAQWRIIDSLFRTNNIRIGLTLCSVGCSGDLHRDDVDRANELLDMAIENQLIDSSILKMKIFPQQED